jgi:FAD/FMN-containing dehydrogenase
MIGKELIEALSKIVTPQNVLTSPSASIAYSYDATSILEGRPDIIVLPQTANQVSQVMTLANTLKIPITPRGGGAN